MYTYRKYLACSRGFLSIELSFKKLKTKSQFRLSDKDKDKDKDKAMIEVFKKTVKIIGQN